MNQVIITSKLTEKEYINGTFALFFSRPINLILYSLVLIIFLLTSIFSYFLDNKVDYSFLYALFFVAFTFGLRYFGAKRNFKAVKRYSAEIIYIFDDEKLTIESEDFKTEIKINSFVKFTQAKNWIFMWTSRQIANIIPKRNISEKDYLILKEILAKNKVKNNL